MSDWTVIELVARTESYFNSRCVESPRLSAEILLGFCLDIGRVELYLNHDRPLDEGELARYRELVRRRARNEPVAYITGKKGFWEHEFSVRPGVLIPRPDTETLVEKALELMDGPGFANDGPARILELGCGSGAVIVSLAAARPGNRFFAADCSDTAVDVTRANSEAILSENQLKVVRGSWLDPFRKGPAFDMILCNPPYISASGMKTLAPQIRDYEPARALEAGEDGLKCIREILAGAFDYLAEGGVLLIEIGYEQKEAVLRIARESSGYESPVFERDLAGHFRVAVIKKRIVNA
ncbi:MAG: peptide chain release factor N(5)-glutamine methyltransferase [Desulfarculaceae bacterium]|nr:peptide chain release factor N(5)-glutamine methyltransferase [Desulfarculaceae bacterium]